MKYSEGEGIFTKKNRSQNQPPAPGLDRVPRRLAPLPARPPGQGAARQGGLFRVGALAGRCVCSVIGSVLE